MKVKCSNEKAPFGYGAIRADEVLPLREAARRLGWCQKSIAHAKREGLTVIRFAKFAYVRGRDVLAFFDKLAGSQADGQADVAAAETEGQ
jgi:hypothetical protein